ncbi:MAG TPA: bifunctional diaminohydroxyphosphoribosylaminopyrimidine deaminase/5-amino-6-(5-phosphoribosylamino)uracil reductase RibD [Gemmatimonadales bacterium]|nr:bifunctional diaminohydroxyphosphoribosylaminopyrimidine deaminase/5-amino-6-(5-phosphoribosylamino)uracil reductase RibD [Gemmatimonadales bacterium]
MTEQEAMQHALSLAMRGWGRVAPNPLVGAVVLREGRAVAEGWHAEYGEAHAERAALAQAGALAEGATVVVTLEPCAHTGKQPPCTEALLAAGVRRVVIAAGDPNPEARGGAARLRAAGIEVVGGVLEAEARRLNAPFFHRFADPERPWVALKLATSREGWIAPPGGERRQLSGPEAQAWVHWLRAGFDAIGVGGRTALTDDPALTVRGALAPRRAPERVVFTGGAVVPPSARLRADQGPRTHLLAGHDLAAQLGRLRREGNLHSLLIEGGGRLAAALVEAGLVDRYYWIETPVALGPGGVPAFPGYEEGRGAPPGRWVETERKSLGPDTLHVMERA